MAASSWLIHLNVWRCTDLQTQKTFAVCSQIHTKHINTLCGLNTELLIFKPGGAYSYHWTWRIKIKVVYKVGQSWGCLKGNKPKHLVWQQVVWNWKLCWRSVLQQPAVLPVLLYSHLEGANKNGRLSGPEWHCLMQIVQMAPAGLPQIKTPCASSLFLKLMT